MFQDFVLVGRERLRDEEEGRDCSLSLEVLCFDFVIEACFSRLILIIGEGEIGGKSETEGNGWLSNTIPFERSDLGWLGDFSFGEFSYSLT